MQLAQACDRNLRTKRVVPVTNLKQCWAMDLIVFNMASHGCGLVIVERIARIPPEDGVFGDGACWGDARQIAIIGH